MAAVSPVPRLAPVAPPACVPWTALALLAGLLVLLYGPTAVGLARLWELDPNYSHGWLVAPLALGLAWRRGWTPGDGLPVLGGMTLISGLVLHLSAQVVAWPLLEFAALFMVLRGWALCVGGRPLARAWLFPSLLLFFMFPLPIGWTNAAAVWLQEWVSRASAAVLNLITVCHRQGYTLTLAGLSEPLVVAEECSGLRQLVAFAALAALLGELRERSLLGRAALLIAGVPAAIVANLARVLLMAAAAQWAGIGWLSTWLHDLPALFTLPLGLGLLLAVDWCLPAPGQAAPSETSTASPASRPWVASGLLAVGLLAQGLLWLHLRDDPGVAFPEMPAALADFPQRLGGTRDEPRWIGHDDPTNHLLAPKLHFADSFINRVYEAGDGSLAFGLYAVYSRRGADREHHPEVCMRDAGGAVELTRDRALVPLAAGAASRAQRFTFRPGGGTPLTIYYWHYTFAPLPNTQPRSWLQQLHQQHRQRPPSLTVQVTAALAGPLQRQRVEEDLLPTLHAVWQQQLPAGVRVGHDRLPIRFIRPGEAD